MKKLAKSILVLLAVFTMASCEKNESGTNNVNASGSLTGKFNYLDASTNKWTTPVNFTANSIVTTKSNNDYTIVAKDASNSTLTFAASSVTATGNYATRGTFSTGGINYNAGSGTLVVTALGANSMTATVILENTNWSFYDGKITATF